MQNPSARHWTEHAMRWSDARWHEDAGLLRADENYKSMERPHPVRATIWYALGLLMRGDNDRAYKAIRAVIANQFDDPSVVYHGTFYRAPEEPAPPAHPTEWKDYDPNWREFICTVMIVMLTDFDLPGDLRDEMLVSIRKAAEGARAREVAPLYTNIALMSAILLDYAGDMFEEPEWREFGQDLGRQTYEAFKANNTFWEYNSPTYYGIDLWALVLWRKYGLTETLRERGAEMEAILWRDIADFYHAGMRNLCGPFDRAYGMDMTEYISVVGLSIATIVPPEQAPLPDVDQPFEHAGDYFYMPPIAYLQPEVPADALPHFTAFQRERQIERRLIPDRTATAWLSEKLMIGAQSENDQKVGNTQFHPATAHWIMPDGTVGWLRLHPDSVIDARASKNRLDLRSESPLRFEIRAHGALVEFGRWALPGLTVETVEAESVERVADDRLMVTLPAGEHTLLFGV